MVKIRLLVGSRTSPRKPPARAISFSNLNLKRSSLAIAGRSLLHAQYWVYLYSSNTISVARLGEWILSTSCLCTTRWSLACLKHISHRNPASYEAPKHELVASTGRSAEAPLCHTSWPSSASARDSIRVLNTTTVVILDCHSDKSIIRRRRLCELMHHGSFCCA
jgi:hypothetical protein